MKKSHQLLKALVLSYFVTYSIKLSFADEQQYYNQRPSYNQLEQENYDQQQIYYDQLQQGFNQAPIYNIQPPQIQMMVPGSPPPLPQEIIIEAPSSMHVWMPGYWNWQNRWIWIPGQWAQPPRPNTEWMERQWRRHEEGEHYRREREAWR